MARRERRHHTAEQKVAILREVLIERRPVSEVCEKHELQPTVFYYWQKQFFENGAAAFAQERDGDRRELERKLEALEMRLAKKDGVIAEVTAEMVKLKKELGEL
jgi:transposase-like protein